MFVIAEIRAAVQGGKDRVVKSTGSGIQHAATFAIAEVRGAVRGSKNRVWENTDVLSGELNPGLALCQKKMYTFLTYDHNWHANPGSNSPRRAW